MPDSRTAAELHSDPSFRALLAEVIDHAITWEDFLSRPQPHEMSPLASWDVLTDLRRCIAIRLKPDDPHGLEFWYTRTHEISDITCEINQKCRTGSRIHTVLQATGNQHFLVKSRINETLAAAELDGLAIPRDDAHALLKLGRAPQNPTEKLVANIFSTLEEINGFADQPFSVDLFGHLADLLLDGVDVDALELKPRRSGLLVGVEPFTEEESRRMAQHQLEGMASYLNQEISGPYDPKVLQGLLMTNAFSAYRPFGFVSTQVGRLAARLHAIKCDLPVLGLLPISVANLAWEDGLIGPPHVTFDPDSLAVLRRRNLGDLTPQQTLSAQLALYTLRELEKDVARWERRDTEMREILRNEPLLNQRQRSILARALRIPEAEFRIRYHQNNHNVAYTTARRDLLELMEKQYLVMEQRGQAFVFLRGPRLDELSVAGERPSI